LSRISKRSQITVPSSSSAIPRTSTSRAPHVGQSSGPSGACSTLQVEQIRLITGPSGAILTSGSYWQQASG
jgi:hypothetical protein